MLAYRHHFHAGNAADVFKHAVLCQLLLALARKDKPFLYLESHAGVGRYDLKHPWAQKNREYEHGIARVLARKDAPENMRPYLDAVLAENRGHGLLTYPGSPLLARRLLRPGDRMVLAELNGQDHAQLAALFARDRAVQVRHMDGYQALKAFLPPQERRGLILIDSSFDRSREFPRLVEAITQAQRRFATGVYAIWYPLMDPAVIRGFEREIVRAGLRKVLRLELALHPDTWREGVPGSAMLVLNPPFGLDETARDLLPWLRSVLSPEGEGRQSVRWLVEE